ncbi:MAG: molybdate ABC transporter permease subunit [Anaerolinea sp.]|nr:molybdate ABC transporter permease subunit [Anaerolinea sp.]
MSPSPPRPRSAGRGRLDGWWLLSLPLLAFLVVPIAALLGRVEPDQVLDNLRSPVVRQAIGVSLRTTLFSTALVIVAGIPVAQVLARPDTRLRRLVDALVDLPTVLPPAVAGIALLVTFGRRGLLGGVLELGGVAIPFTQAAVVLAQLFVSAPFFIKSAAIGFGQVPPDLRQAAGLDGASSWQVFRFVTVPLARTALITGAALSWARALGEFGATIIFAGNFPGRTQTMPLAIYIGFELDFNLALTLSAILIGLSLLTLLLVKWLLHPKAGADTPA